MTAYFSGWWEKQGGIQRFNCKLYLQAQYQETQPNNPYSVKELLLDNNCYDKSGDFGTSDFNIDLFSLQFYGPLRNDASQSDVAIKEVRLFPNVVFDVNDKEHHRMMEAEPVGSRA